MYWLSILILSLLMASCNSYERYIFYNLQLREAKLLYEYLNGIENGYFVDIGAFHSFVGSNTMKLVINNWRGINIDASYRIVKSLNTLRPGDLNLNYAIGSQPNKFIQFYNNPTNTLLSTVDASVSQRLDKQNVLIQKVPTISLLDLCQRYYIRRPQFMNLDTEGVGQYAIEQNNWQNKKCRPQIIFVEINIASQMAGLTQTQKLLVGKRYKKMSVAGENTLFIDSDVLEKYKQLRNSNYRKSLMLKSQNFQQICSSFFRKLGIKEDYFRSMYSSVNSPVFVHFAKIKQDINIDQIRIYSNGVIEKPLLIDRPIVIYQFDAKQNVVLTKQSLSQSEQYIQGRRYYVLNMLESKLVIYILDMNPSNKQNLTVINLKNRNNTNVQKNITPTIKDCIPSNNNLFKQASQSDIKDCTKQILSVKQSYNSRIISYENELMRLKMKQDSNKNIQNDIQESQNGETLDKQFYAIVLLTTNSILIFIIIFLYLKVKKQQKLNLNRPHPISQADPNQVV